MSIRVVVIAFTVTLALILPVIPAQAERQIEILEDIANQMNATVFSPGDQCAEDVHLTGNIHLVTDVRQVHEVVEITVFMTLVGVEGKGAHTGARYPRDRGGAEGCGNAVATRLCPGRSGV